MRKVIVAGFVSLDGVMQGPGAPEEDPTGGFEHGGWVVPYIDEVFGKEVDSWFAGSFDLLLGRKTYEIFAAHWPHQSDDEPIAKRFNAVTKYVATRSPAPLAWRNSVVLQGDAAAAVGRLKQEDGPDLVTQGSTELIQTLLAHDLVDEVRILTFPVVLGSGKRMFGTGARPAALELTHSAMSTTGVTVGSYRRAGALKTGSFGMEPPSAEEVARRERMKREG